MQDSAAQNHEAASSGRIAVRKEGAIGWLVFDNPARRNALSHAMWRAIPPALADFAADPAIRIILLAGAGDRAFVSGADISEFASRRATAEATAQYNVAVAAAIEAIRSVAKPTIAMIRGYCIGGGLEVALCCDLRIAAEDASFGIPAAKLAVGYGFEGVRQLVDIVGPAYAKEIFYTARQFDAAEALQMGLVNRVVPVAGLERIVCDYAETIAANAPLTIAAAKLCVDEALKDSDKRNLAACREAVETCLRSADHVEGPRAFMEKRRPKFRGT